MILVPYPLPDEFDRNIQRRLREMNDFGSDTKMFDVLKNALAPGAKGTRQDPWAKVELLARTCRMNLPSFIRQHTTLPLRRAITSYRPELVHGSPECGSMLRTTVTRRARRGAYLCQSCVTEDAKNVGIPYWRLSQQLPGAYWCESHQEPLAFLEEESAFYQSPEFVAKLFKPLDRTWVKSLISSDAVQRFLGLCTAFMKRDRPLAVSKVSPILRERAKVLGLNTYGCSNPSRPLLSDLVQEKFPKRWLATVSPKLVDKPRGEMMLAMDGVLYLQNAASSSLAYILAMAVLYDSVDDALSDLTSEISPERLSYGARRSLTVEDWDDQKALETYCQHRGSAADIARNLSISVPKARRLLSAKGLPDLGRISNDPLRVAVKLFYLERASWDAACERSGVNTPRFEAVVRTAGSNFCAALSVMDKQTNAKPEVQLRPKPLSPLDPE